MKSLVKIFIVLIPVILLASTPEFEYFSARSNGDYVRVEWKLISEDDVYYYVVEKYVERINNFKYLKRINSDGNNRSYTHIDEDNFFKEKEKELVVNNDNVNQYRIKVVLNDGSSYYSDISYVTHNVSSVKKTWGMLKEMFR